MMYVTMRSLHENNQESTIKDEWLRNNFNVTQLTAMPSSHQLSFVVGGGDSELTG